MVESLRVKPAVVRDDDAVASQTVERADEVVSSPADLPTPRPDCPTGGADGSADGAVVLDQPQRNRDFRSPTIVATLAQDREEVEPIGGTAETVEISHSNPVKDLPGGAAIADPELDDRIADAEAQTQQAEAAITAAETAALSLLHAEQDGTPAQVEAAQDTYDAAVATADFEIRDAEAAQERAEDYARTMYGIELGQMDGRAGYTEDLTAHNLDQRIDGLAGKLNDAQGIVGDDEGIVIAPDFDPRPRFPNEPRPELPPSSEWPNYEVVPYGRHIQLMERGR